MTHIQIAAFLILGGMMLLFIWGRLRYDLVAMLALLASLLAGTVKPDQAFSGFSDDIVIIVGSALVVSAAVGQSGIIETLLNWLSRKVTHRTGQLAVLVGSVAVLSALVKNIGALAMMMPAAFKMAKRSKVSPSLFLMPMSFGSLLGGLITLVGTSPNIIVSRVREQLTGEPFGMFDYAPVGLGLTVVGVIFLMFSGRLLPKDRRAGVDLADAVGISDYNTEATVPAGSKADGMTVGELLSAADGGVVITGLVQGERRRTATLPDTQVQAGDTLLLRGEPDALERIIARTGLSLIRQDETELPEAADGELAIIEAVVAPTGLLANQSAGRLGLYQHHGINLIAISRAGHRMTERLGDTRLLSGDVLLVQGPAALMPERMSMLGLLPLAERSIRLGSVRKELIPLVILAVAMGLTAAGIVPVAIAFFGAAAMMMVTGAISPHDAYQAVEWPILVMLGALIPVSESLHTTGGTDLIGGWLSSVAAGMPAWGALALIMTVAMAVTPFLNNAATVLVMAPIAVAFAGQLGFRADAFLMAVAVGAGCDFLTPIGHQCNTLVMGPGGYRFADYARLGAPLTLLVVLVGVPLILAVWGVN